MIQTVEAPMIETWPIKPTREAIEVWRTTPRKQAFNHFFDGDAACAVGVLILDMAEMVGWRYDFIECPTCHMPHRGGMDLITHWNDDHKFTFKEIADMAEQYDHLIFREAQ